MTFCVIHLLCPLNREIMGQINIGLFVTKNFNFGRDVSMVSARVFVFSHVSIFFECPNYCATVLFGKDARF